MRSKAERRQWWANLTETERTEYIRYKMANKRYAPRTPTGFEATGVNESNKAQWMRLINRKNPWLKVTTPVINE